MLGAQKAGRESGASSGYSKERAKQTTEGHRESGQLPTAGTTGHTLPVCLSVTADRCHLPFLAREDSSCPVLRGVWAETATIDELVGKAEGPL